MLFEQGNTQELVNHILNLLNDNGYYLKIAAQGVERAKKYDINFMVEKHIDLYKDVLKD